MKKKNRLSPVCVLTIVFLLALAGTALGDDAPPSWMRQAASVSLPGYDNDVEAVVLHNDQTVAMGNDGVQVTTENYAVKILTREGRRNAVATARYLVTSGKVRAIEAWLIRPNGTSKNYDKKVILDLIMDPDDIYDEYRMKVIRGVEDAEVGSVFGYSVISEDRPIYFQERWLSQFNLPTVYSRYTLALPSGWKASGVTYNHPQIAPQVNGSTYTWELRNLPNIRYEPMSPAFQNLVPWVGINYGPEKADGAGSKVFANWTEVSRWMTAMHDGYVIVNDEVAAKAQELTANAKTELDKIRAIASFVQNMQYISIDIGVGSGNGYRPRPSNVVLARGFGDCKDKANLMRAMLKSLKIEAYPIAIFSGDPTFVREDWVSPAQFNHCIIAVKVSDATNVPTVITHPSLGRLLIFDATDPYTTVGDLPEDQQGSFALVGAGDNGGLLKMPVTPAEANLLDRQIEVTITPDGSLAGKINERSTGQSSTMERAMLRQLSATDYNKMLEGWLTRGATGAKLVKFLPTDRKDVSGFDLDVEFSVPRYAQLTANGLLVFRPVIVGRRNSLTLTEPKRDHPVIIDSGAVKESAVFSLPAGYVVDEIPDALNLDTPFGKYITTYEVKEGKLYFSRSLTLNRTTVSVEKYNTVREFFSKMRDAEQSPVVLARKK